MNVPSRSAQTAAGMPQRGRSRDRGWEQVVPDQELDSLEGAMMSGVTQARRIAAVDIDPDEFAATGLREKSPKVAVGPPRLSSRVSIPRRFGHFSARS
jgi:hypothetical protein